MNELTNAPAEPSPAHITVLLREAVEALAIKPDGTYVDGTFGRGGHSRAILERLGANGRLIAIDRDPCAVEAGEALAKTDKRFSMHHVAMSELGDVLEEVFGGRKQVLDGMLADLGVSSPQLDEQDRGFSFRFDGPLDMRMDTTRGETVEAWLNRAEEQEIGEVIWRYGEERFARQIARAVIAARVIGRIRTTRELAELVGKTVRTREPGQHPATRTFQALRIFINQELEEVEQVLPQAMDGLRTGGRLVVIAFHSLEDRIVKRFMQNAAKADHLPSKLPIRANEVNDATLKIIGKPVRATDAEVAANPRARSAIMRTAQKL
ncbi:MAG: 16S rRNA (cytosine(1402)-N(4))-methyltransferase RsmH [Betaproteobacteria bacterium]|nr:16S rRNA (cytosine(1402)-N(4))-methyltransferase RsmH [Betaproteobacteria bacterium]